ncbi:hypothetical protein K8Z61_05835 [Nocardioides sp. TRM66260-LWL]|uniref:hypothetical protein n=1 Tax=Nocardioides sp. TRM66260-LWL TaxID=2874478 RepID=UPI001CC4EAEB|nr:hypothetical protein [Nocardioides sp. TRM66260-LWL]MBZ5734011.1 hypothetical protein [Nocardioides sp. TRM66260-LWL]
MRRRPLGWELGLTIMLLGLVCLGALIDSEVVAGAALVLILAATPLVVLGFVIRLLVGICVELLPRRRVG